MKILSLGVMNGPNVWSNYRQNLIVMKLDLGELERRPTHRIDGFAERIKALMPSLYSHRCSEDRKGGFFQRVEQGTWMGHVIEHIALEMQTLAGMDCGYGRTRSTDKEGVYHVVFAYRVKEVGLYVAKAAVEIARALVEGKRCDLESELQHMRNLAEQYGRAPEARFVVDEAHRAEIPYHFANDNLLILGYGKNQVKLRPDLSGTGRGIGLGIARSRFETARLLAYAQIGINPITPVISREDLEIVLSKSTHPVVLRPEYGNHRRNTCLPISEASEGKEILDMHLAIYKDVVAQRFLEGDLFRVLLINHKIVAVLKLNRRVIAGDGHSSLAMLDQQALYTTEADLVPALSQKVVIDGPSQLYEDDLSPLLLLTCERVSRVLDLGVCGIDIIAHNLAPDFDSSKIIGIDHQPDLKQFLKPVHGDGQNVIRPFFDMLFPKGGRGRVPLVAVRGIL